MDLLTPGIGLIFWQTVVFVLLILLLAKVAWKPILNSLKEREDSIQESLDFAEKAKQDMLLLKADNEKLLQEARGEREKILRETREAAGRLHDKAEADAKRNADKIVEDAKNLINAEKKAALHDVKTQVAMLSLEIAEKVIKKNLSKDNAQRELVNQFVNELKIN